MTKGVVAPQDVYPPLSWVKAMSRKVKVPSFRAPARMVMTVGWRVGDATNSSFRLKTSLTGLRVSRARCTAIGS